MRNVASSRADTSALESVSDFEVCMVKVFSSSPSSIKPYRITNPTYNAMGRVVRAIAEIEDILTLHLCALADITEGHAMMLLGAIHLSKKKDCPFICECPEKSVH